MTDDDEADDLENTHDRENEKWALKGSKPAKPKKKVAASGSS